MLTSVFCSFKPMLRPRHTPSSALLMLGIFRMQLRLRRRGSTRRAKPLALATMAAKFHMRLATKI